jgi:hypothetical protein
MHIHPKKAWMQALSNQEEAPVYSQGSAQAENLQVSHPIAVSLTLNIYTSLLKFNYQSVALQVSKLK